MFRAICRKTAETIIKLSGSENVAKGLVDVCVECAANFKHANEVGKKLAQDFLRRQSQTETAAPWLSLKPIFEIERMEFLFKPYNPRKGEIQSVINGNKELLYSNSKAVMQPWLMMPTLMPAAAAAAGKAAMVYNYKLYSPMKGQGQEQEQVVVDLETSFNNAKQEKTSSKLVGSSQGWVASYKEGSGDLRLWNPVSRRSIELPPVLEEEKAPRKVMVSCPQPEVQDCRAIIIYASGRLAYCCPATTKKWTPVGALHHHHCGLRCVRTYEDFVYSTLHKRFFTLLEGAHHHDQTIKLESWDLADLESPRLDQEYVLQLLQEKEEEKQEEKEDVVVAEDDDDLNKKKKKKKDWCRAVRNLVVAEHSNQVFLVTRYIMDDEETIDFDVHKIRVKGGKLKYMKESLDGLAMFVGMKNECFAVPASEYPGLNPDSIYFTNTNTNTNTNSGSIIGMFDYINRRTATATATANDTSSTSPHINHLKCAQVQHPPLWFTPTLYGAFLTY